MPLKSEVDTPQMERRVRNAFSEWASLSDFETHYEHGHWWVIVGNVATYSVVDASGGRSVLGFDFEQV